MCISFAFRGSQPLRRWEVLASNRPVPLGSHDLASSQLYSRSTTTQRVVTGFPTLWITSAARTSARAYASLSHGSSAI